MTITYSLLYDKIYGPNADKYRYEGNSITDKYLLNGSVRQVVETFDFSKIFNPFDSLYKVIIGPYLDKPFIILDVIGSILEPSTTESILNINLYTSKNVNNSVELITGIDMTEDAGTNWLMSNIPGNPYISSSNSFFIGINTTTTVNCNDGKLGIKIIYSKD